ncbi:MAG: hypothetical protein U0V75_08150 [Ferruginibacter sp.]
MKFFSKITFFCNLCFIASVILRFVENAKKKDEHFDGLVLLKPLESTLVVLGYTAIFVNILFLVVYLLAMAAKKNKQIPRWIVLCNLVFFVLQVYYFFFSSF